MLTPFRNQLCIMAAGLLTACSSGGSSSSADRYASPARFVTVAGHDLLAPDGSKLYIRGTNLGNWLNPEGYMFGFSKTNSAGMINKMFCQLVGEDGASDFWERFKELYYPR